LKSGLTSNKMIQQPEVSSKLHGPLLSSRRLLMTSRVGI